MDINTVFDLIVQAYPKAREGKTLGKKPKSSLVWTKETKSSYVAQGPRGGVLRVQYNEKSNKITIGYTQSGVEETVQ